MGEETGTVRCTIETGINNCDSSLTRVGEVGGVVPLRTRNEGGNGKKNHRQGTLREGWKENPSYCIP